MMPSENTPCPELAELTAFANGDLTDAKLEHLAIHIDQCESCGMIVDASTKLDDSELVAELRALKVRGADLNMTTERHSSLVPIPLLKAARGAIDPLSFPVSFDSGKRLANRLKNGPVRLGRFELLSELGVGSFGYVFKARDTQLDRFVALKIQRAGTFATNEEIDRFVREAQSIARLKHPGIVTVYDTIRSEDDVCYLVTEYVDGESLEERLKTRELGFEECANLIAAIGDSLHYAHENGIVHRDVKPSNVLVDQFGKPHLMDFGLAKRELDVDDTMTSIGRIMGTPAYMSPEQASGDSRNVDPRSDVYSLGVILYEMLTGERPFQGNHRMLLLQVMEDEPRLPRKLNANIPRDLETICLKSLSKSQTQRYQSAAEMSEDLRRFTRLQPIKARPLGRLEKLWRWCRAFPMAASLLIAAPLVSMGGFVYLSWLSTHFVQSTALESTRMEANMLEDINDYYSESVIGRIDQNQIPVTHKYTSTPNSLPLPFTFMIDAGRRITENESGMQVKIYSDYPWRNDCGPQNDFEATAIQALGLGCRTEISKRSDVVTSQVIEENLDGRSYYEFGEVDGKPMLRYARAQIMKQSCVECHNREPTSPKRNWVEGEVAGVLSITRPLARDIESTRLGLRSAFNLIAVIALTLTCLTMFVFWTAKRHSSDKLGV